MIDHNNNSSSDGSGISNGSICVLLYVTDKDRTKCETIVEHSDSNGVNNLVFCLF